MSTPAEPATQSPARAPVAVPALPFSFAFQPIVDPARHTVFSQEALIRGPANEPAFKVLGAGPEAGLHAFDHAARLAAIALAARLGLTSCLNLNFLPNSLFLLPDCVTETLATAQLHGFEIEQLVLEVTEGEVLHSPARFGELINAYRGQGLKVAIDDFGAGYSGLNMLADFQPDQVKIDMNLVRGIDRHGPRQAIARAIIGACNDLGIEVIAEGVESASEHGWLANQGVELFQGYWFARPTFEALATVDWHTPH